MKISLNQHFLHKSENKICKVTAIWESSSQGFLVQFECEGKIETTNSIIFAHFWEPRSGNILKYLFRRFKRKFFKQQNDGI